VRLPQMVGNIRPK